MKRRRPLQFRGRSWGRLISLVAAVSLVTQAMPSAASAVVLPNQATLNWSWQVERSSPRWLENDYVSDSIAIFLDPNQSAQFSSVRFLLDGAYFSTDNAYPFDFNGSAPCLAGMVDPCPIGAARLYDTHQLKQGRHTVTAYVSMPNENLGFTELTAQFTVTWPTGVIPRVYPNTVSGGVRTTTADAASFLYTGSYPSQTGVSAGAIDPSRAAVVHGRVTKSDNAALSGVKITMAGHPEYGQTYSRTDGAYDIAVNGGGVLTVNLTVNGYITAQRQVTPAWQGWVDADPTVLLPYDANSVAVTPSSLPAGTLAVARGSTVTDTDGTRTSTLLVPAGVTANLVMPNGTRQAVSTLTFQQTEFTVGATGQQAMPAPLPPTSAYTYAVDLSLVEQRNQGAIGVEFSAPIWHYNENFLNFPVGTSVPAGYYDYQRQAWVPATSGRVVKVLSVTGGLADVDIDGDGLAESAAGYVAAGMNDGERTRLSQLYAPGASLWRVGVTHFCPWDFNWGWFAKDAKPPKPKGLGDILKKLFPNCSAGGSVIGCESQSLGENLPLVGSGTSLSYQSTRVPDSHTGGLLLTVTPDPVPPSLLRVDLSIQVAGREFTQSFPPTPNLTYFFDWDGKDVFGRQLNGSQVATVKLTYRYLPQYTSTGSFGSSGNPCTCGYLVLDRRGELGWTKTFTTNVSPSVVADARQDGLGGLLLGVHHTYDPQNNTLAYGDGSARSVGVIGSGIVSTVAGNGVAAGTGDDGQATSASLNYPGGVAFDATGNLYVSDTFNDRIRKVTPAGVITTIAGTGAMGFAGDGAAATSAQLHSPLELTVAPDGSVVFADVDNHRVRSISPAGVITTVAGNGTDADSGDGNAAVNASLSQPVSVAVASDGTLYIADYNAQRVRKVSPDGVISTIAGTGTAGFSGDDGPAVAAQLNRPSSLVLDRTGVLYIADSGNRRVRSITPDGLMTTVAGTGTSGSTGDAGQAVGATFTRPVGLALGPDDTLYVSDQGANRIRQIRIDGTITTLTGTGVAGFNGNNLQALNAQLDLPRALTVSPEGSVVIADAGNHRVRAVSGARPGLAQGHFLIPSPDGAVVYQFDPVGRHEKTVDGLTGKELYAFGYDSQGRIASVTDSITHQAANTITIEHPNSTQVLVHAPDGNTTTIGLDANGWASDVTTPGGRVFRASYTTGGLLLTFTDPRGHISKYDYDSTGRLYQATGRDNKVTTLTRTNLDDGYQVVRTTPMGRTTIYKTTVDSAEVMHRTITDPAGQSQSEDILPDGTMTVTADASVMTTKVSPDPRWGMLAPYASSTTEQAPGHQPITTTSAQSITLNNGNLLDVTSRTTSSQQGSRTWTSAYDKATGTITSTSAVGRTQVTTLDANGRVASTQAGNLAPVVYEYDARGRLYRTSQTSGGTTRATATTFDAHGFTRAVTSPRGTTTFTNDLDGRPTSTDTPAGTIGTAYDDNSNPTSLTPPGRPTHTFGYADDDRLSDYSLPNAGSGVGLFHYDLNDDRQYKKLTLPSGATIDFAYDTAGRLQTLTRGSESITFDWTGGHLTSSTSADGVTSTVAYTGVLPTGVTWAGGGLSGGVSSTVDDQMLLRTQTVTGTPAVSFDYDDDRLLTTAGAETLTHSPSTGLLTGTSIGASTTTITPNGFGEPDRITTSQQASPIYDVQFTGRDLAGRTTDRTDTLAGVTTTDHYDYDPANRLWKITRNGTFVSTYLYDAAGNPISEAHGGTPLASTYDNQDRILTHGTLTYVHDVDGERTSVHDSSTNTTTLYGWKLSRLSTVTLPDTTVVSYLYDASGNRVGKKVNGTLTRQYLWGSGQLLAEADASGAILNRYVYGTRGSSPDYVIHAGATYRLVGDERGSIREVLNVSTGAIAQRLDYDEWGRVTTDTAPGFQPLGYAGGLYDTLTGLDHFGDRDYDPASTHWLSRDPSGFSGGLNTYAYVANDPVNNIDPTGHGVLGCLSDIFALGSMIPGPLGSIFSLAHAATEALQGHGKEAALALALAIPGGFLLRGIARTEREVSSAARVLGEGERASGEGSSLRELASEVRGSGLHPAARNQRVIAVGADSQGGLFAGSSNGFDAGQRAALERLGINRVPGSAALHAEEELLRGAPDLQRIGTSVRGPCGSTEHDCALQLLEAGVEIEW